MGMYTGLRGTIAFKPDVARNLQESGFDWIEFAYHSKSDAVKAFANKGRSGFIPKGALCYMPNEWDDGAEEWLDDTTYSFACSLKNYDGEIQAFLHILPEIAESWYLEELYEENEFPETHRSN